MPGSVLSPTTARLLQPLILALAIVAAYWSGLHAPFQFDDAAAIVENVAIRHWWPFARELPAATQVAGRPVVALSYALNFQWAGLDPFGYRVVNLLIHFACAWLLFALAREALSRAHGPNHAGRIAAAIAVLQDLRHCYNENFEGFSFTRFDGTRITI